MKQKEALAASEEQRGKEQLTSSAPEPKQSIQDGGHLVPGLMSKEGHEG